MKLTKGVSKESLLFQFGFIDSKIGVAINKAGEIVECISYDNTNTDARKSVFTSMIYNGWIEDGKKQSSYKYSGPKELWQSFRFLELKTKQQQTKFLKSIQLTTTTEQPKI